MDKPRRNFLRHFGIGVAGAAASVVRTSESQAAPVEVREVVREVIVEKPVAPSLVCPRCGGTLQYVEWENHGYTARMDFYRCDGRCGYEVPAKTLQFKSMEADR